MVRRTARDRAQAVERSVQDIDTSQEPAVDERERVVIAGTAAHVWNRQTQGQPRLDPRNGLVAGGPSPRGPRHGRSCRQCRALVAR